LRPIDFDQSGRHHCSPSSTHVPAESSYASEVNPIEQVWGSLKSKELANLCSDTIDEVADTATDGLERIGGDVALCFAFLRHSGLRL
jgi:hypothetical protein